MPINRRNVWEQATSLAAAALVFSALGGGFALAQDKPTVYVIAPSLTDPFWITEQNGAKQAGEDFGVLR